MSISRTAGLLLFIFFSYSCRHTEISAPVPDPRPSTSDGFSEKQLPGLEDEINDCRTRIDRLNDESNWLRLRIRAVEARKIAELTNLSELELTKEMAKYGRLNERFPGKVGFLKADDKTLWNYQLQEKRGASEKTAAVARLIERDLIDFKKDLQPKYAERKIVSPFEDN